MNRIIRPFNSDLSGPHQTIGPLSPTDILEVECPLSYGVRSIPEHEMSAGYFRLDLAHKYSVFVNTLIFQVYKPHDRGSLSRGDRSNERDQSYLYFVRNGNTEANFSMISASARG